MPERASGRLLRRGFTVIRAEMATHPVPFAVSIAGAAVYAALTVATSYVFGRVTDRVVTPGFEGGVSGRTIALGALAVLGVALLRAGAIVWRRGVATVAQRRVDATLRTAVVDRYAVLPFSYHASHPTGELMAHASGDAEAATDVLAPLPFACGVVALVFFSVAWLVATDPFLAVLGLLLVPALLVLNLAYQRRMEGPATRAQDQLGEVSAVAHESIDGAMVVKALGAERAEAARFRVIAEGLRDAKVDVAHRRAGFDALLQAVPTLGIVALVVVGAQRIDAGAITPGVLVSFISLFTLLSFPLQMIGYVLAEVPRAVAGWDRIAGVLAEPVPVPDEPGATLPDGPLGLEVEHLAFSHVEGSPVLEDVSFTVPAGATVALVGATGSGKSTLVLLLARLLEPERGRVRLGGQDIADLAPGDLAAACSVAFQEPFLFGTSIEDNVTLGDAIGADEVADALALAGADFVGDLADGAVAVVGERGATLSGGQRQRVALARALARRPRLLLLDDATSAVDATTEAGILSRLRGGLGGATTLVVANRPATLALADSVLYLEDGRVAGAGTVDELLATVPGFERLVRAYEQDRADDLATST